MKRTILTKLTLSALLLPGLPLAAAAQSARAPLPAWYAQIDGGVIEPSSDQAADRGKLVGLRLGGNLDPAWSFEAEWQTSDMTFDAGFDLEQTTFAFNLVQYNRTPLWNPYFLLGLGGRRFEVPGDSDTRALAQVGVGGVWDLAQNGIRLRVEARYRYAPLSTLVPNVVERGEPVLTIGLMIPLGPNL